MANRSDIRLSWFETLGVVRTQAPSTVSVGETHSRTDENPEPVLESKPVTETKRHDIRRKPVPKIHAMLSLSKTMHELREALRRLHRTRYTVLLLCTVLVPAAGYAQEPPDHCRALLPSSEAPSGKRPLSPEDLVRLRDIGPSDTKTFGEPNFTISPDGKKAAFQIRQADPLRNSYCLAMVVINLQQPSQIRIVDQGGEPVLSTYADFLGFAGLTSGILRPIEPHWSPDGSWFAFLKRAGGRTQVWRAFVDGRPSSRLSDSPSDVIDFAVSSDGTSIILATTPDAERQRQQNEKDGLNGWHYDARFLPGYSKHPQVLAPLRREATVLEIATRKTRIASSSEAALVGVDRTDAAVAGEPAVTRDPGLEISSTDLMGGAPPGRFSAISSNGRRIMCNASPCDGARDPWRMARKDHVGFFRLEGWALASTAIYDWNLKTGRIRRAMRTDDLLLNCTPSGTSLLCLAEASLSPRKLIRLDPMTGKRQIVFDPNPEFNHLLLGRAERLHWRNAYGLETIGDLVLPVGYQAGKRYPLVVVQYDTRGFLRGGTGDEYPIQAFANRGYAVLSYSHPHYRSDKLGAKTFHEADRLGFEQFAVRKNFASSIEAGVEIAVHRGIADPARLGITGLSDGSTSVEWELNHHPSLFSAAALSSCCKDPAYLAHFGPLFASEYRAIGYPGILQQNAPFWNEMALERVAHQLHTPTLINVAEDEALEPVETFTALREAGVPVDMFIYPGEHHDRWQPAHRLATYRRSLDWFDYWLRGVRSKDSDRQSELKEWDRLKTESGKGHAI